MIRSRALAACLLAFAGAASPQTQALPKLDAPVNDFAHVIDPASAAEMDRRIRALEAATHDAVVVVTVDTYAPYGSIEDYAVRLYEHAGIGQKGKDNGVLIVAAMKDRKVRIEVGYDLEQFISAGYAGETIRNFITPAFREGKYGAGLLAGSTRLIRLIADRRGVTLTDLPAPVSAQRSGPPLGLIIFFVIILMLIIARTSRRRRGPPGFRGPWGGTWSGWHGGVGGFGGGFGGLGGGFGGGFGGGGGGFGGFGGGRSGGGGASGGW